MKIFKRITSSNIYCIALCMMQFNICMAFSSLSFAWSNISFYFSLIFFIASIVKIISTKYSKKEAIISTVIIALSITAVIVNRDMRVLWFALTIVSLKGININKVIKNSLFVLLTCFIINIFLSLIGVTEHSGVFYQKGVRFFFGMQHPNIFSAFYNMIVVHILYIYYNKLTSTKLALLTIFALLVFILSRSNTGLILYIIVLLFLGIVKMRAFKKKRTPIKIITFIMALFALTASTVPIIYSSKLEPLDRMVTGRFSQPNYYYKKYGIHLFGKDLLEELNYEGRQNILDNGYSRMYLYDGLAYFLMVTIGYCYIIKKTIYYADKRTILLISFYILYLCSENVATFIFMNTSMFLIPYYGYDGEKNVK